MTDVSITDSQRDGRQAAILSAAGAVLKKLRKANSVSLEELAAAAGVCSRTLGRIEHGKAPISLDLLFLYQDLFGVSVTDIIAQIESNEI